MSSDMVELNLESEQEVDEPAGIVGLGFAPHEKMQTPDP
jgi:hypothetical protein